ncbi:hypothetical protein BS50DRAFT_626545 [Corynespora cassiicola Philippines]|uniref:Uncharacterized protein n=1 Tax=Corynespora cassiicola Philippines TaxID=1448308 RepID=A0A2T2N2A8_CORCC|nr:hypothetical protein BS50DRAFT_626545 [Corynespora cassiicola Philippines]
MTVAQRIFVSISNKSIHWSRAWNYSDEVVEKAVARVTTNSAALCSADAPPQIRILVKERWTSRLWIVFDIFNKEYDPGQAHLPGVNDLPVIIVSFGENDIVSTSKLLEDQVNDSIRQAHDNHGVGSEPPFVIDHTNGQIPTYSNPRTQHL